MRRALLVCALVLLTVLGVAAYAIDRAVDVVVGGPFRALERAAEGWAEAMRERDEAAFRADVARRFPGATAEVVAVLRDVRAGRPVPSSRLDAVGAEDLLRVYPAAEGEPAASLLGEAYRRGRPDLAEALVARGADPTALPSGDLYDGLSRHGGYRHVAFPPHPEVDRLLTLYLDAGGDPDRDLTEAPLARGPLLHVLAAENLTGQVRLLRAGADPWAPTAPIRPRSWVEARLSHADAVDLEGLLRLAAAGLIPPPPPEAVTPLLAALEEAAERSLRPAPMGGPRERWLLSRLSETMYDRWALAPGPRLGAVMAAPVLPAHRGTLLHPGAWVGAERVEGEAATLHAWRPEAPAIAPGPALP